MQKAGHIDVLERRDSLRNPLFTSIAVHTAFFAFVFLYHGISGRSGPAWGSPHALGGGSVGITPVAQIPLPSKGGPVNPVANDTESNVPAPPKPEVAKRRPAPPDAIPLRARKTDKPEPRYTQPSYRQYSNAQAARPNQVYSSVGQALSSPMYGAQSGSGGVGVGRGAFGNRFGYYTDLLTQKVSSKWHTEDVDPRLRTAPPAIVVFEILRNGQTRNIRILSGSGNAMLDRSAMRAIYEASPFPPLPAGYDRDSVEIEFWFYLKR